MIPENPAINNYIYSESDSFETYNSHRLCDDLGIGEASAEVILHLRRQVMELQSHIRKVEAELQTYHDRQTIHWQRCRVGCYDAVWIEFGYTNGEE